jgi:hypothetical protein
MATCMLQHLAKKKPMLKGCGEFDVYCQLDGERKAYRNGVLLDDGSKTKVGTQRMFLPQHFNLQQLHDEYPNATWILPLRDHPKTWATSVLKWFRIRFFFFNEYVHKSKDGSLVFPNSVEEQYNFLVKIYEEHTKLIQDFVKEHPSHKLVQVNISDPDAGIVMEEAFGYSRQCWGHANAFGNRTATDFAKTVIVDKT